VTKPRRFRITVALASVLAATLLLTGCTSDPLADQYRDGTDSNYISGEGVYKELPVEERGDAVEFTGVSDSGDQISSDDYAGEVFVVNFWYAGCPPCRLEAADLKAVSEEYTDVPFLGVNIFDTAENAITFENKYGIAYPSIIDAQTNSVQLAFAGQGAVAPNAVPTTLIIDREGRVAGRISGLIQDKSILTAMIDTVLAEDD